MLVDEDMIRDFTQTNQTKAEIFGGEEGYYLNRHSKKMFQFHGFNKSWTFKFFANDWIFREKLMELYEAGQPFVAT